jgi:ApaG protein
MAASKRATAIMSMSFEIPIHVDTFYIAAQSDPTLSRYVFAYTITIKNHSNETVQLLRRYWLITDANGKETEVHGEGVVGEQPQLAPGSSYSYTSGAVLDTPVGTMQGYYEMTSQSQLSFKAAIPLFRLAMPNILN